MSDDVRVRVSDIGHGQYEAYLQTYCAGWNDSFFLSCGLGNSIEEAVSDLRKHIRTDISVLQNKLNATYCCDIVDDDGNRMPIVYSMTLAEMFGID